MQNSMPFQIFLESQFCQNGAYHYIALTGMNCLMNFLPFYSIYKTVFLLNLLLFKD